MELYQEYNEGLGFGVKLINLITWFFNSIRVSVLVNSAPTKEFSPKRGLRHGDPLSPLLFNKVGSVFSKMLEEARDLKIFSGMKISGKERITHQYFADYTIIILNNGIQST